MKKELVKNFIILFFQKYGDEYYIIWNNHIAMSKNKTYIAKKDELGFSVWNDEDVPRDFDNDLQLSSGDEINKFNCEIINIDDYGTSARIIGDLSESELSLRGTSVPMNLRSLGAELSLRGTIIDYLDSNKEPITTFECFPNLKKLLDNEFDEIQIIRNKTGKSQIFEHVNVVLSEITKN